MQCTLFYLLICLGDAGNQTSSEIPGNAATAYGHTKQNDEFHTLYDKDQTIAKTWQKMVVVREPFQRLLSAYRNKIEPNRTDYFGQVSKKIAKDYGNSERHATFSEFLRFYLDEKEPNEHWDSFASLAQPCKYDYKYILKESFERIDLSLQLSLKCLSAPCYRLKPCKARRHRIRIELAISSSQPESDLPRGL